jgi:hypothetical protein
MEVKFFMQDKDTPFEKVLELIRNERLGSSVTVVFKKSVGEMARSSPPLNYQVEGDINDSVLTKALGLSQ